MLYCARYPVPVSAEPHCSVHTGSARYQVTWGDRNVAADAISFVSILDLTHKHAISPEWLAAVAETECVG